MRDRRAERRRRMSSQALAVAAAILALLTVPALASATDVNFDDLAAGTAVNQYPVANPAVSFVYPTTVGFTIGTPGDGVASQDACGTPFVTAFSPTNSAPNMGAFSCGGSEFPAHGTFAVLTNFANSVSAYVGDPIGTGYSFQLDAYDINRHLLGSDSISTSQIGPTNPISFTTPGTHPYTIAYVAVYALGNSDHNQTGMDDFSFNPCTPGINCNPEISLSSSAGGGISQGAHVNYQVSLFRHNGSNGNVTLSAAGLPSGVHASFNPTVIPLTSTTSTLGVSVDNTAPLGTGAGAITATPTDAGAGSVSQTDPLTVTVEQPFGVYVGNSSAQPSQSSISVAPCSAARETVRTLLGLAFAGSPVNLGVSTSGGVSDISSVALDKPSLINPNDFNLSGENEQSLTVARGPSATSASSFQVLLSPTSGPFTEPTATVTVNRSPARIDSFTPTSVLTPQSLHPGTEVTIRGAGFCPGSTVAFGNAAAVAPDSISPDGTQIKIATPPGASSGSVTVTSGGQQISASGLTVNSYRNVNGYPFKNFQPHIVFSQMELAFGHDQTYDSIDLCWPFGCNVDFRDPIAMLVNAVANASFTGDCFGFSLSSQRFLEGQRSLGDFPPGNANTIFGLDGQAGPSGPITDYLNANQVSQLSTEFLSHWLADAAGHDFAGGVDSSATVFNEIRSSLALGHYPLIALHGSGEGHVVIAYNIEGAPPDWHVDVYDSNLPFNPSGTDAQFTSSRIAVDADGNWSLPSTDNMSGDMSGFVVTDPTTLPSSPTMIGNPTRLTELGHILFGSAGAPDTTGTGHIAPPPSTVTQVSDSAGHMMFDAHGNLNRNRRTRLAGVPFAPLVGRAARPAGAGRAAGSPMLLLPRSASNFTETVTETGHGPDTHTILGQGFAAQIGTSAARGTVNKLGLSSGGASFNTTAAAQPLTLTLIAASGHARRVAGVTTKSFHGGGDTLSFIGDRSGLQLVHRGSGTSFSFTLSGFDSRNAPEIFQSGKLHIGRGRRAIIGGIKWNALQGSRVRVTVGGHTVLVRNRLRPPHLATVAALHITHLAKRTVRLTINARLGHLPPGAVLAFAWTITRSGKKVTRYLRLEPSATRSASVTFSTRRGGRYTFRATVTVATISGVAQSTSRATRKLSFRL